MHMHARLDKINAYALWLRSSLAAVRLSCKIDVVQTEQASIEDS